MFRWFVFVMTVAPVWASGGPAVAADVDEIVRDWESIAADSQILHYRFTGERTTFTNAYNVLDENMTPTSKSFPDEPVTHPYVQEILIDTGSDRSRLSLEGYIPRSDEGSFSRVHRVSTVLWNETRLYKPSHLNGGDADVRKDPGPFNVEYTLNAKRFFGLSELTYWGMFYSHGHLAFMHKDIDNLDELRNRFNLKDTGIVETDGGRLLVVRFDQERPGYTSTTELHLDPVRRHRVQRARSFAGETLVSDTELTFTDLDSGSFRVSSIRGKRFDFVDGRPIDDCRCKCEIAETLASVPDSRFWLEIPAGAWVRDVSTGEVFQWNPSSPE